MTKNFTNSNLWSISSNLNITFVIKMNKNWSFGKSFLELVEDLFCHKSKKIYSKKTSLCKIWFFQIWLFRSSQIWSFRLSQFSGLWQISVFLININNFTSSITNSYFFILFIFPSFGIRRMNFYASIDYLKYWDW